MSRSDNMSLLLVTYNRIETLKKILSSINSFDWKYDYFIIVDNNSIDGTKEYLEEFCYGSKKIIHLRQGVNVGHGAALRAGLEYLCNNSDSGFYILLEDDSIPESFLPLILVKAIKDSNFDLISSYGMNVKIGKRIAVLPKNDEVEKADFCLLDGAIIRSDVVRDIGYPVKDWFMMFDDFEYCVRIKKAGYVLGVIKNNFHQIMHYGGGDKFSKATLWRGYYQTRNHVLFLKEHFSLYYLSDFLILFFKRLYGASLALDRRQRIYLRIIGMIHGVIGKKGRTLDPLSLTWINS